MREYLISYRFAVVVISILLGASAAGWIMTELIPPDFPERIAHYGEHWGRTSTHVVRMLRLYDPFHSLWYKTVLALFVIVLVLCMVTRWKRFLLRSFRIRIPEDAGSLRKRSIRGEIVWPNSVGGDREEQDGTARPSGSGTIADLFAEAERYLRTRGYSVSARRDADRTLFAAVAGRWRSFGSFLFHAGILVVTVGGVIGSFWGGTEYVYGRAGDKVALPRGRDSLLVEDFRILVTERNEIRDYISTVAVVSGTGDTVAAANIEVNHPLRHAGMNIYQSSYHVVEGEFDSAEVEFETTIGSGGIERVTLRYGESRPIGSPRLIVRPLRFLPDFRMGRSGPYSASAVLGNPALEIEVRDSERYERGWLFLDHPRFNTTFDFPVRARLVGIEPYVFTGLQVSYNPGEHVFVAGILIATIGVGLLYFCNHRSIGGLIDRERFLIAGTEYRWKVSFEEEFERISQALRERFEAILKGESIS